MNLKKLLVEAFIPNHPEMRTKTLTQTMDRDSIKKRVHEATGAICSSDCVGVPSDKKSACTVSTRNIATMRSNSMLDSRSE